MQTTLFVIALIALISSCAGFLQRSARVVASPRDSVRMASFDLDRAVNVLSKNRILTKTAELGLLTRLEKAGFTLSQAAPLLKLADELDVIGILEASSDKVFPLLATAIDLSPKLLPLAAVAVKTPPSALTAGAAASALAAIAVVTLIPDDSVASVALQTALVVPLGVVLPGALGVGSVILSKLGNK